MSQSKPNRSGRDLPTIVPQLRTPIEVDLFFLAQQNTLLEDIPRVELTTQAAHDHFNLLLAKRRLSVATQAGDEGLYEFIDRLINLARIANIPRNDPIVSRSFYRGTSNRQLALLANYLKWDVSETLDYHRKAVSFSRGKYAVLQTITRRDQDQSTNPIYPCEKCGQTFHRTMFCRALDPKNTCEICNERGHFKSVCPKHITPDQLLALLPQLTAQGTSPLPRDFDAFPTSTASLLAGATVSPAPTVSDVTPLPGSSASLPIGTVAPTENECLTFLEQTRSGIVSLGRTPVPSAGAGARGRGIFPFRQRVQTQSNMTEVATNTFPDLTDSEASYHSAETVVVESDLENFADPE